MEHSGTSSISVNFLQMDLKLSGIALQSCCHMLPYASPLDAFRAQAAAFQSMGKTQKGGPAESSKRLQKTWRIGSGFQMFNYSRFSHPNGLMVIDQLIAN